MSNGNTNTLGVFMASVLVITHLTVPAAPAEDAPEEGEPPPPQLAPDEPDAPEEAPVPTGEETEPEKLRPDLVVSKIKLKTNKLCARIANQALPSVSGRIRVSFYVRRTRHGRGGLKHIGDATINGLAGKGSAGSQKWVCKTMKAGKIMHRKFYVRVDPKNAIPEINEENNAKTFRMKKAIRATNLKKMKK